MAASRTSKLGRALGRFIALDPRSTTLTSARVIELLKQKGAEGSSAARTKIQNLESRDIESPEHCVTCKRHLGDDILLESPEVTRCDECTAIVREAREHVEGWKSGNDVVKLRTIMACSVVVHEILRHDAGLLKGIITKAELEQLSADTDRSFDRRQPSEYFYRWMDLVVAIGNAAGKQSVVGRVVDEYLLTQLNRFPKPQQVADVAAAAS